MGVVMYRGVLDACAALEALDAVDGVEAVGLPGSSGLSGSFDISRGFYRDHDVAHRNLPGGDAGLDPGSSLEVDARPIRIAVVAFVVVPAVRV